MPEVKTIPAKYIFLDIVGFTHNRSVEAQSDIIQALNNIVQSSIKEHGINKDDVMFLSASDDICVALLNVGSPYDIHLKIALDIVGKVYKHSINTPNKMRKFEVRAGVNSYTDNLVTDINGNRNIAGAGVNLASRIMKLGDGNQVLVSKFVFDDFRQHEKYASSFKLFRAKIREDVELPVYQFIAGGYEGLNVSTPISLRDSTPPKPPIIPKPQISEPPRPAETIRSKSPVGVEKAIFVKPLAVTQPSLPKPQAEQTLSYLTGILPEPEKAETKSEWTKAKTEPLPFLEQSAPPNRNRSFVWAFATILMLGGAGLGAWYWMSLPSSSIASQTPANTATPAPTAAPVNNPTAVSSQAQNQPVQTVQTPKPTDAVASVPDTKSELSTRESPAAFKSRPNARRAPSAPRPVVQRTVAQRPPAKPQTARASKPKPTKRVTLEDLIN